MLKQTRDQARQTVCRQLDRIATVSAAGGRRKASILVRRFLWADTVKLDAAFRVLGEAVSFEEAAELAGRIDLFQPCERAVTWWRIPKRTTGSRIVCQLPSEVRAAHLIILDVLQAQFRPGHHLYGVKGRGRDELARSLRAAMEQGRGYAIQGDIREAFSNVDVDSLYDILPLPAAVIRHMLDYRNLRLRHDPTRDKAQVSSAPCGPLSIRGTYLSVPTQVNGPTGLLAGFPASNLILAIALAGLSDVLPPGCAPYLYADNVLVAARTEEECRRIEPMLIRYFAEHPAGPFTLDKIAIDSLDAGIGFLGYAFERDLEGEVAIIPNQRGYNDIIVTCCRAAEAAAAAGRVKPETRHLIRQKLSGFSATTDPEWIYTWVGEMMNESFNEVVWAQERGHWPPGLRTS